MMVLRGISVGVVVVLVLLGLALGASLGRSEWMNPSQATAEARRMEAETAALVVKNTFDQRLQQVALEEQQAVAEINRQSTIALKAKELEWHERYERLKYDVVQSIAVPVALLLSGALTALMVGAGILLTCLGLEHLRRTSQRPASSPSITSVRSASSVGSVPTLLSRTSAKRAS